MATSTTIMLELAIFLLAIQPVYATEILSNASLRGVINCSLTGAKFPASIGQPMVVTYTGSMELVADGTGKFVSGHMSTRGTGDVQAVRGSRSCEFNLTSGTYTLGSDGTGHSVTTWGYWEGGGSTLSDQLCSDNVFHPQHFQGLDLNNMRKERNRVVETFVLPTAPDRMIYWVGMDETGLTVAVCKQQQPEP
jgi:hypothetical protein